MDDLATVQARLADLEAELTEIRERLSSLESRVEAIAISTVEQQGLRRFVEMKTGRSVEMSSRIAQRLARCEAAIDLLARPDAREAIDHA